LAPKKVILYDRSKCTGCRLCMLACSWVCTGTYRPSASVIVVDVNEKLFDRSMSLDEERCTSCLSCVANCPGGALSTEENGAKEAV
jgi:Fe-S-cluster-containing hydrogenase component 2